MGTYNLFQYTPRPGTTVRFVDADDFDGIRAASTTRPAAFLF
jgi:O-acetylhomoserine/O-acetylserine sulfhydrylase-like pyridoxal-dependent enzyme